MEKVKLKSSDCKVCSKSCEEQAIKCDLCKWWIHAQCEEMTIASFNFFTKHDDYVWLCKSCRLNFRQAYDRDEPDRINGKNGNNSEEYLELKNQMKTMEENIKSLQNGITNKLKHIEENLLKSMEKQKDVLNDKVVNMSQSWSSVVSKNIKKTIENNQVITAINNNLKSVKSNIDSSKDREEEIKARKGKECNIVVFNIPECLDGDDEENCKAEESKIKQCLII